MFEPPKDLTYDDLVKAQKGCDLHNRLIFIPGHIYSSKNSKRPVQAKSKKTGKSYLSTVKSNKAQKYDRDAKNYYMYLKGVFHTLIKNKQYPIHIWFIPVRKTNAEFDYHNIIQGPADLMQKFEWFPEDSNRYVKFLPLTYLVDKQNPGLILHIP